MVIAPAVTYGYGGSLNHRPPKPMTLMDLITLGWITLEFQDDYVVVKNTMKEGDFFFSPLNLMIKHGSSVNVPRAKIEKLLDQKRDRCAYCERLYP